MDGLERQGEPTPSVREFLYHAHDQRRGASAVAGVILALALLAAALVPAKYRATATLVVLPSPEFTVREAAGSHDSSTSALALDQIMKAETEILGSDDLHEATLRKMGAASVYPAIFAPAAPGLAHRMLHGAARLLLSPWRVASKDEDAARLETGLHRFASDLCVLPAKDSNVIALTFDSADGRVSAAAINTMLGLYAARRSSLYDDPQLELVRGEAEASARAVGRAEQALASFKRLHAISDYNEERDMLLRRRSQSDQEIDDASVHIAASEAEMTALTRLERAEPETLGVYEEKDPDTRLQVANAGLQDLRAKLAAARDKYKDSSRVVTALRAQITADEAESSRLAGNAAASVVRRGRNPSVDALHLDRARAMTDLASAQAKFAALRGQRQQIGAALDDLNAQEAQLSLLERQKSTAQQAYLEASRILADRHLSEAEDAQRLANVRVIQPAIAPQHPRSTAFLIIAAGIVFSGLGAVTWVVAMFMCRPVFMTAEGLESITGLRVLAVFPREPVPESELLLVA